jgi:hypothetical protein
MRLTLRLFALALLISVAAFTNVLVPVSYASPCEDGCWRGYTYCMGRSNPPNQGQCANEWDACMKKYCRVAMVEVSESESEY